MHMCSWMGTRRKLCLASLAAIAMAATVFGCGGGDGEGDFWIRKQIDSGWIEGKYLTANVRAFFGIPYAAPPVGALRWKEPQAVAAWSGVRETKAFGAACAQSGLANGEPISEDCLFLNVWVPPNVDEGAKVPVIVYVHGGGFTNSSPIPVRTQGEQLAKRGVIYVSMNYRLGVFANLALPELTSESPNKASGNKQLLDIVASLQWVQRNIARFGGDPGNVTLTGQSSGAINLGMLQASPLVKGLVHRVLAQSGSPFAGANGVPAYAWAGPTLATAEATGLQFMSNAGVSNLAALRAKTMAEILAVKVPGIPPLLLPAIDGYALPDTPKAIFAAGKQVDVPTVVGNTAGEAIFDAPPMGQLAGATTVAGYQTILQSMFGTNWLAVFNAYPAATDAEVPAAALKAANAHEFGRAAVYWANSQAATGKSSTYLFIFSRLQNGKPAPHGSDNQYWHGELLAPASDGTVFTRTAWDTDLANAMMDSLVAFAKTGNPSTGAVAWPRYDPAGSRKRMNFGETIAADWDPGLDVFIANKL
jgi:para-nitrobenzyl esterase